VSVKFPKSTTSKADQSKEKYPHASKAIEVKRVKAVTQTNGASSKQPPLYKGPSDYQNSSHHQRGSSIENSGSQVQEEEEDDDERMNTIPMMGAMDIDYYDQSQAAHQAPKDLFNETIVLENHQLGAFLNKNASQSSLIGSKDPKDCFSAQKPKSNALGKKSS
jgi:hypothetical protein